MKRRTQIVSAAAVGGIIAVLLTRALRPARQGETPAQPKPSGVELQRQSSSPPAAAQAGSKRTLPTEQAGERIGQASPRGTKAAGPPTRDLEVTTEASTGRMSWGLLLGLGMGLLLTFSYFARPGIGAQRRTRALRWVKRLPGRAQDGFWAFVRHEDPLPEVDESEEAKRWMPDRLLRDQIRQALGGLLPHPKDVRVRVRRGFVRLSGTVPEGLRAELLKLVQEVPGVMELEDRLNAR